MAVSRQRLFKEFKVDTRPVAFSKTTMTELVLPSHTNALGTVFGGTIMSWIDVAAAICAHRHARKSVVTAHVDELTFVASVYKGWVVNLYASLNFVGKTSMEVGVRVEGENPENSERLHMATAYLTFVALDSRGKPTSQIPQIEPQTEEEKRRHQAAQLRRQHRLEQRQQLTRTTHKV